MLVYTSAVRAETTECTVITSLPTVITTQGVYCLKGNLATGITTGNAIDIKTNNVTIDFNNFKLGGLAAGANTEAIGVYANARQNITLRNGNIRGFQYGIHLNDSNNTNNGGHVVENNRLDKNTYIAMWIRGSNNIIRGNQVNSTGIANNLETSAYGIVASGPGVKVLNNVVDDTQGTGGSAFGIYTLFSHGASIIMQNSVSRTEHSGTSGSYGITQASSARVLIKDNVVINSGQQGTAAIRGQTSAESLCRDNSIMNFATGISDCLDGGGNVIQP